MFPLAIVLQVAATATQPAPPAAEDGVSALLDDRVVAAQRSRGLPGLAAGIVRGDELVWSRVLGVRDLEDCEPLREDTLFPLGPMTGAFTTTLAAILRDGERIDLDAPLVRLLPAEVRLPRLPPTPNEDEPDPITLRHLMSHTSGLPGGLPRSRSVGGYLRQGPDLDTFLRSLAELELANAPGEGLAVSQLGQALLGHALEQATGDDWQELLTANLLDPLGMVDTTSSPDPAQRKRLATGYMHGEPPTSVPHWDPGAWRPAVGLYSTLRDLARFLSLQLGTIPPASALRASTRTDLHRPHVVLVDRDQAVAWGWFINRTQDLGDVVRLSGPSDGHSVHLRFSPRHGIGVVLMTNLGWSASHPPLAELGPGLLRLGIETFGVQEVDVEHAAERVHRFFSGRGGTKASSPLAPDAGPEAERELLELYARLLAERGPCIGVAAVHVTTAISGGRARLIFEGGMAAWVQIRLDPLDPARILGVASP